MQPLGGTEIQLNKLYKYVDNELLSKFQICTSIPGKVPLDSNKINILWEQNSYDQGNIAPWMQDKSNHTKYDWYVFNSHWVFEKYRMMFGLPEDRCMVIKNAIDNFPGRGVYQQGQELKIIHQITPWRGLNVLLGAMQIVKNKKVTLDVYSSTQVYGDAFKEANDKDYEALYDQARKLDNVNYIGYKPNEYVLEKLSSYHMFVYPSIWEETSCISAIECMAAGHYSIVTNFGALYETCADWPTYINYEKNYKNLSIATAHTIDQVSEVLHTDKMQQHLADQQKYYERFYSWEKRKVEWTNFLTGVYNASRSK